MKFNKNEFGWKEKVSVNTDGNKFSGNYEDLNNEPFTFFPIKLTETSGSNGTITAYCDVFDLEQGHRYVADFTKYDGICLYTFNSDNTKNTLVATTAYLSTGRNGMITIMNSSATKRDILWMSAYGTEQIRVTKNSDGTFTITNTLIVPRVTNTREFTPTSNYHLVHKKYVDDKFIAFDLMETVGTIPQSELQKCNNGTSRYVSSIDFDTLFSEPNNYLYYATYKDDTLIPIEYQSNYNRMVTRELDSVNGLEVIIGFDYGTHMMYPFNGGNDSIKAYTFTNDLIIKRCPLINANIIATKEYVDDKIDNSLSSADAKAIATGIYNTQLQIFDGKLMDNVTYYQSADYNVTPTKNGIYVININKTLGNIGINDRVHIAYKYKLNGEEKTCATSWKIYATTGTIVSTVAYFGSYLALIEIVVKQEYVDVLTTVDNANTCGISLAFHNSIPVDIVNEIANSLEISLGIGSLNVLTLDNKEEYTPTLNYNPATKKYVDDAIASQPQISFDTEGNLVVTIGGVTKKFKEIPS